MKRNIQIEALAQIPLEKQRIELVERKCLGHPDSIADGVAEAISRALCKEYIDEFGAVLHHNTDQGEIVAGESDPKFGGGKVIRRFSSLLMVVQQKGSTIYQFRLMPSQLKPHEIISALILRP